MRPKADFQKWPIKPSIYLSIYLLSCLFINHGVQLCIVKTEVNLGVSVVCCVLSLITNVCRQIYGWCESCWPDVIIYDPAQEEKRGYTVCVSCVRVRTCVFVSVCQSLSCVCLSLFEWPLGYCC